ncbi:MAG: lysophospholipid acyltransferase family protein [Elusimicrobiota bacterium]
MNYYIGRFLFRIIFRVAFRLNVYGRYNMPAGPCLIVSNHNSLIDPPLVSSCLRRPIYFMAKKELFDIPVFGDLIRSAHAFPVNRHAADLSTVKKAIKLLKSGRSLLLFPEGTRKKSDKKIHRGVSLLAHKAGVPVVPCRLFNNEKPYRFRRLACRIGKPVNFSLLPGEKANSRLYLDFAEELVNRIYELQDN